MDKKLHLLLVDDDEIDRRAVQRYLRRGGLPVSVQEARTSSQALEALRGRRFDCVLLDHRLPDGDAFDLLRAIASEHNQPPPVIVLTGQGDESLAVQLIKAGATDYIPKEELSAERLAGAIRTSGSLWKQQNETMKAQSALQASEALNHAVLQSLAVHMAVLDPQGNIVSVNEAWTRFGCENGAKDDSRLGVGMNYLRVCRRAVRTSRADAELALEGLQSVLRGEKTKFSMEYACHAPSRLRWFSMSVTPLGHKDGGAVVCHTDITDRKSAERNLFFSAFYDSLTGLPNRELFLDKLETAVRKRRRQRDRLFALLFLDLDHFKMVNDSMGHTVGDQLLVTVGKRLQKALRETDSVARLGGDEFVVLLDDLMDQNDAVRVVERMQAALAQPLRLKNQDVYTSASMGIVICSGKTVGPEELLRNADTAMYRAKNLGRSRYVVFGDEMHEKAVRTMQLRNDLWHALERDELVLHYQPIVSVADGSIGGIEALMRWQRPGGIVGPGEFIAVAEETGLIINLDHWGLREAARQASCWEKAHPGAQQPLVHVNFSSRHFRQNHLMERIDGVLEESGIDPRRIVIEITESAYVEDPDSAASLFSPDFRFDFGPLTHPTLSAPL